MNAWAKLYGDILREQYFVNKWNALVSAKIIKVEDRPDHFRLLHPTKGWRRFSKRRLGLA